MSPKFTLFDPDIEPTDEQLAKIMHEAGDLGRKDTEAAKRWCREQIAIALHDAMLSSQTADWHHSAMDAG